MNQRLLLPIRILFMLTASTFVLYGCMVGPDYERPKMPDETKWAGLDPAITNAATKSKPVDGAVVLTQWWTTFNDPLLTQLIERAATGNFDMAAAEARIRQARARRGIVFGGLVPNVDAFGSAAKNPDFSNSDGGMVGTGDLFTAGFDASWELDIFGRVRRNLEATDAGIDRAIADRRDVWVSLAAEVASTYAQVRAAQEQLRTAHGNLDAQRDTQSLTRKLFDAGIVGALDVANSTAQVESTTSRIPAFESSVREGIYSLSVLLGQPPATLLQELSTPAPIPTPPAQIPVGLPSELLQRRPDLRRAEADLHMATARVGAAVAEQYPRISLTGGVGTQTTSTTDLVGLATQYWSVGAGATLPLFEGGRIQSNIALQKATTDEAVANYRKAVLIALKEVEVALISFSQQQTRRAALNRTVDANRDAVGFATELYAAGRTDFLNVLAAQRSLLDSMESLAMSDRAVVDQSIALYKALGGGWDTQLPTIDEEPVTEAPQSAPPSDAKKTESAAATL